MSTEDPSREGLTCTACTEPHDSLSMTAEPSKGSRTWGGGACLTTAQPDPGAIEKSGAIENWKRYSRSRRSVARKTECADSCPGDREIFCIPSKKEALRPPAFPSLALLCLGLEDGGSRAEQSRAENVAGWPRVLGEKGLHWMPWQQPPALPPRSCRVRPENSSPHVRGQAKPPGGSRRRGCCLVNSPPHPLESPLRASEPAEAERSHSQGQPTSIHVEGPEDHPVALQDAIEGAPWGLRPRDDCHVRSDGQGPHVFWGLAGHCQKKPL